MYAPIYLPQTKDRSTTVVEHAIIDAEGPYHVDGRYVANEGDARQERRRLAERRVREAERRQSYQECARGACDGTARFRLSTWVTARERQQVDAAALDCMRTAHRETLSDLGSDLARGNADGILVSAARFAPENVPTLSALVDGFPAHAVVGLVGEIQDGDAVMASLLFGQAGVRVLTDIRRADGWRELRGLFDCGRQPDEFMRQALATILADIGATPGAKRNHGRNEFFRLAFSPRNTSAKELAHTLGVLPSTLMSRFFRAALPSPKQYVVFARLVWAAHLAESPAMSIAAIAARLDASSAQSFHRTVRTMMGTSAAEFRAQFDGATMLDLFRSRLVTPYLDVLRSFDPLADTQCTIRRPAKSDGNRPSEERRVA